MFELNQKVFVRVQFLPSGLLGGRPFTIIVDDDRVLSGVAPRGKCRDRKRRLIAPVRYLAGPTQGLVPGVVLGAETEPDGESRLVAIGRDTCSVPEWCLELAGAVPKVDPPELAAYEPDVVLRYRAPDYEADLVPLPPFLAIGRGQTTEDLYRREEARTTAINKAAESLAKVMGWGLSDLHTRSLPAALVACLDSYAPTIGIAAAIAYLQQKGLRVVDHAGKPLAVATPSENAAAASATDPQPAAPTAEEQLTACLAMVDDPTHPDRGCQLRIALRGKPHLCGLVFKLQAGLVIFQQLAGPRLTVMRAFPIEMIEGVSVARDLARYSHAQVVEMQRAAGFWGPAPVSDA